MKKILISWIGRTDLRAVKEAEIVGLGPIAQAIRAVSFDQVLLLNNYPEASGGCEVFDRQAGGNKTRAAKLLGLPNYQTLDNWLKKYGV